MVGALFDTNILIDYLNGIPQAKIELDRYSDKAISLITWMEVMVGATPATEAVIRGFLSNFLSLSVDNKVADLAATLRRQYKIKLPDAIIWATAQVNSRILITRDSKDFYSNELGICIPYVL